jgi:hypothetical protein
MVGIHVELERSSGSSVAGEDSRTVAVRVGVHDSQRLVCRVDPNDRQHRSEDLVLVHSHVGVHSVEQAHPEEEAVPLERVMPPVDEHLCALVRGDIEVRRHLVAVGAGDERAHLRVRFSAGPDAQTAHPLGDGRDERVGHRADCDHHRDGHAAFAG